MEVHDTVLLGLPAVPEGLNLGDGGRRNQQQDVQQPDGRHENQGTGHRPGKKGGKLSQYSTGNRVHVGSPTLLSMAVL